MGEAPALTGPDFTRGVELADVPEGGMLLGNAHGEAVLLVRHGGEVFAIAATCERELGWAPARPAQPQ